MKNHLTANYPYIRAENSSTGWTSIHRGFCKMLWYCSILFYFESGLSIVNQWKNNNIFTGLNVFFKAVNVRFWRVSQSFDFNCHIFYYFLLINFIILDENLTNLSAWQSISPIKLETRPIREKTRPIWKRSANTRFVQSGFRKNSAIPLETIISPYRIRSLA